MSDTRDPYDVRAEIVRGLYERIAKLEELARRLYELSCKGEFSGHDTYCQDCGRHFDEGHAQDCTYVETFKMYDEVMGNDSN